MIIHNGRHTTEDDRHVVLLYYGTGTRTLHSRPTLRLEKRRRVSRDNKHMLMGAHHEPIIDGVSI